MNISYESYLRSVKDLSNSCLTVQGLTGTWSKSLELPEGFQRYDWFSEYDPCGTTDKIITNLHGVTLNDPSLLAAALEAEEHDSDVHLYTQHEIFLSEYGTIQHTRSSPNWEGGLVTFATCKHLMRTYDKPDGWVGLWLMGLCPKEGTNNCVLFCGKISMSFPSNYHLSAWVRSTFPRIYQVKRASTNPRGDLYSPLGILKSNEVHNHYFYEEPIGHTRSVEGYKKSPGSTIEKYVGYVSNQTASILHERKIPKWWRDLEYIQRERRPPVFILSPCFLFSRPMLYTTYNPRRAVMRMSSSELLESLRAEPTGV